MAQVQVQENAVSQENAKRIVFLNALPLNSLPRRHVHLDVIPVSLKELAGWIARRLGEGYQLEHYIRHESTIQVLKAIGIPLAEVPNAGIYKYRDNDVLVVVSLRNPVRGQEVQVTSEDLEVWVVTVS